MHYTIIREIGNNRRLFWDLTWETEILTMFKGCIMNLWVMACTLERHLLIKTIDLNKILISWRSIYYEIWYVKKFGKTLILIFTTNAGHISWYDYRVWTLNEKFRSFKMYILYIIAKHDNTANQRILLKCHLTYQLKLYYFLIFYTFKMHFVRLFQHFKLVIIVKCLYVPAVKWLKNKNVLWKAKNQILKKQNY